MYQPHARNSCTHKRNSCTHSAMHVPRYTARAILGYHYDMSIGNWLLLLDSYYYCLTYWQGFLTMDPSPGVWLSAIACVCRHIIRNWSVPFAYSQGTTVWRHARLSLKGLHSQSGQDLDLVFNSRILNKLDIWRDKLTISTDLRISIHGSVWKVLA